MNRYRFVTTLFGEKHLGMLLVNLFSIRENAPSALVSVFWQEISDEKKLAFKKAFPHVEFFETQFDLASTKIKRISSKTVLWSHAAHTLPDENVCFFDVDMLVLQDIGHFFDREFDLLFTDKVAERFPLNTGVMLTKGAGKKLFFPAWLHETMKVLNDPTLLDQATSTNYPYGGADQMAFYTMLGYEREKKEYSLELEEGTLNVVSETCARLNETRSTAITPDTHIIHYKGGWQMMLLHGRGFTPERTKRDSWPMYMLYLGTFSRALAHLNASAGTSYTTKDLGIVIPFYLEEKTLKENKFLYQCFAAMAFFERVVDSASIRFNRMFR